MSPRSWGAITRSAVAFSSGPSRLRVALKAAGCTLVILVGSLVAGDLRLGLLATLGAFTVLYGPATPARFRLRLMSSVGLLLVASAALGALTSGARWLEILALAATAAVAVFFCLGLRVGPPGAFFFVLVHGVAGLAVHRSSVGQVVGIVAIGAFVAIVIGMSDLLLDPRAPEREAVETAQRAVAQYEAERRRSHIVQVRAAASTALQSAWVTITDAGSPPRWADRLRGLDLRYAAATARFSGGEIGMTDLRGTIAAEDTGDDTLVIPMHPADLRNSALGRVDGPSLLARAARWPSEELLVIQRVVAAAIIAGVAATLLGVSHVYWAVAFSTLVLHQGGTRHAQSVRAVQRLLGTTVGLGLFGLLSTVAPSGWALVVTLTALQFLIELLVARNYALAVVFITPLALTIGAYAAGVTDIGALLTERALDTVVAVLAALASLAVVGRRTEVPLLRAYARDLVHDIDRVLRDIAEGHAADPRVYAERRALHHHLLESDRVGRRALADDADAVAPYRAMERALGDLGYLVLGLTWLPATPTVQAVAAEARRPLAEILDRPVHHHRPAAELLAHVTEAGDVLRRHSPA